MASTEMSIFKTGVPAYLQTKEALAINKALAGGGGGFGKRISIKGSVFRMIVDGEEVAKRDERFMDVVIVAASPDVARTYYEGSYKEGETVPPICWSKDGTKPDDDVKSPQSDICAKCPQNVGGSGQGESRACRYSQRVAVVLENDLNGPVYQMSLPAQSIFGKGEDGKLPLKAFAKFMSARNAPMNGYVTKLSFDTNSATPKLFFGAVRALEQEEYNTVVEQGQTPEAVNAITFTVAKTDGVVSQQKEIEFQQPPKTKKSKAVTADATKDGEEPTVKAAPKIVPPAKTSNIDSILSKWADDAEG